jgi:hypothetical protein
MKLLVTWLFFGLLVQVRAQPAPESSVKAVFIYNFTRFVEWPETAFTASDAAFVIGIVGADPLGPVLLETVSGERVGTHPIRVQRFQQVSEVKGCHMLYISAKEPEKAKEALASLPRQPMLIVGETPLFVKQGGMIRFINQNNKIRLEINPVNVRAAQLVISSKLLQVAQIVE